jgi:hypothetical protein
LQWPERILIEEQDITKSCSVDGMKAFLWLLHRHKKKY